MITQKNSIEIYIQIGVSLENPVQLSQHKIEKVEEVAFLVKTM